MKYPFTLFSIVFIFLNQLLAINNLKETIALDQLTSLQNAEIKIKKVPLLEDSSQWILSLPNATVVNEGGILTEEGYILEDTRTSWFDQHGLIRQNRDLNSENPMYFNGKLAVISSPRSENWYHWLFQVLSRLIILKESDVHYDRLFINNLKYRWQIESFNAVLDYLKIPQEKVLAINGDVVLQASTLIVPSVPFIPQKQSLEQFPSWLKNELRKIFLDSSKSSYESYEKIYISRAHASHRRITNEPELIAELQKQGFKVIYLELLSPYQQAHIFDKVKMIVGPHGSGFANLVFAKPGTIVIEIDYTSDPPRSFYKKMSALMNCNYRPFYIGEVDEDHLDKDMEINVPQFLKFVKK